MFTNADDLIGSIEPNDEEDEMGNEYLRRPISAYVGRNP